jgi:hypothetical protein
LEEACVHEELQHTMQRELEEAHVPGEVQHIAQRTLEEERVRKELRRMTQEETHHNTNPKEKSKNLVSDFLHCCLKVLSDPIAAKKLTYMLTRCMEEGEMMLLFLPRY